MADAVLSKITELQARIEELLTELGNKVRKSVKNENQYIKQLNGRVKYLEWTINKYTLQFEGTPPYIFKREIFYCELGYNIGSEQNNKRPVVILQNDRGNASSPTTIVSPITTHENSIIIEKKDGFKYYQFFNDEGQMIEKKLDYYEIPVELEPNSKKNITGYINLAQIKTISKKRLSNVPVGKITTNAEQKIKLALNRLL